MKLIHLICIISFQFFSLFQRSLTDGFLRLLHQVFVMRKLLVYLSIYLFKFLDPIIIQAILFICLIATHSLEKQLISILKDDFNTLSIAIFIKNQAKILLLIISISFVVNQHTFRIHAQKCSDLLQNLAERPVSFSANDAASVAQPYNKLCCFTFYHYKLYKFI